MDVRMCSMMAPTPVVEPEGCLIALGSGGSNRIRTALVQVLRNLLDFEMPIGNAIAIPRVHFEANLLNIEIGFDAGQVAELTAKFSTHKLWDERNLFFGGVHAARFDEVKDEFSTAGDRRRGGSARIL